MINYEGYSQYAQLVHRARVLAQKIVINGDNMPDLSAKAQFILKEAAQLANAPFEDVPPAPTASVIFEIIHKFESQIGAILSGQVDLVQEIEKHPDWWERLMLEFPLGGYGDALAAHLVRHDLLRGTILELGSGIGNTSRKLGPLPEKTRYIRTDVNIKLLRKVKVDSEISFYDFNQEGRWRELDLVFATNALHCAKNKKFTLAEIYKMLKSRGRIVLAEGSPRLTPLLPSPLNFLCGIYDGWWDIGGFLPRETWKQLLYEAGFQDIGHQTVSAGDFDLGGLVWATK